jgi:hypothetical protein
LNVAFPVDAISKSGTLRPTSEVSIPEAMFTETYAECNTKIKSSALNPTRRRKGRKGRRERRIRAVLCGPISADARN